MANFFSLQNGNILDSSTYGYSLTSADNTILNNTTATMLLTSDLYSTNTINFDVPVLSAIGLHLSYRAVNPAGTLTLKLNRILNDSLFLDKSPNKFTITTVGSAYQSTFTPFSPNGWSTYFNTAVGGTVGYLCTTNAAAFGTSDFTIECWVNVAGANTNDTAFIDTRNADNNSVNGLSFAFVTASRVVRAYTGTSAIVSAGPIPYGVWTHLALVRAGTTMSLYINGVSGNGATNSNNYTDTALRIGYGVYANSGLIGMMSNLRVIKGTAIYTANFTPSTSKLTAITNTSLLTLQDNVNKDNSTNNLLLTAVNGGPVIRDTSPFTQTLINPNIHGGSMVLVDGSSNITVPTFTIPTVFTLEYWYYYSQSIGDSFFITNDLQVGWTNRIQYGIAKNGTAFRFGPSNLMAPLCNRWNHIAICRSGLGTNQTRIYVNGVATSGTVSDNFTGGLIRIGGNTAGMGSRYYSNIRFVPNVELYTANTFTPPTSPLSSVNQTALLLNTDNYGSQIFTENYAISSFVKNDNSDNILVPISPNWQILKLTNSLSVNSGDIINFSLKTSNPDQLSLMGVISSTDGSGFVPRLSSSAVSPTLTSFKPYTNFDDSFYLNGTNNYYQIPANKNFNFLGDFTIEFWMNTSVFTLDTTHRRVFSFGGDVANGFSLMFSGGTSNVLTLWSNASLIAGTISAANGNWNHIAVTRYSNVLRMYVNGVQSGSVAANSVAYNAGVINGLSLGSFNGGAGGRFQGYINQFRIVNGTAVYTTSAFTPPTSPLEHIPNTVFLLKPAVRYNQALITNTNSSILTGALTVNTTQLSATSPFDPRGWSYRFGTGVFLNVSNTSNMVLGNSNFTIEFWFYPIITSNGTLLYINGTTNTAFAAVRVGVGSNGAVALLVSENGTSFQINTNHQSNYTLSAWNHVAVVRQGQNITTYINGVSGSGGGLSSPTATLNNGGLNYINNLSFTSGNFTHPNVLISNLRIVKGTALYSGSTITPPTSRLTNVAGTALLLFQDNYLKDNSDHRTTFISSVANISATPTSPFTPSVPYTLSAFDGSIRFTGSTTDIVTTNSSLNFSLGLLNAFTIEGWFNASNVNASPHFFGFEIDASNRLEFYRNTTLTLYVNGTNRDIGIADTEYVNKWVHIAIVKSGVITTVYFNGSARLIASNIPYSNGATRIALGGYSIGTIIATNQYSGLISNFRFVNGAALYLSNFTPTNRPSDMVVGTTAYINASGYSSSSFRTQPFLDDIHIGGCLKGLNTEPITVTVDTIGVSNLYVHNKGTLTFPLTSSKRLALYGSNGLQINSDGTLNIGTSSVVIPLSTTHTILLSNNNINVYNGGNLNIYGYNKPHYAYLEYDTNLGSYSFMSNSNLSSHWRSGDRLSFTSNLTSSSTADNLILSSFLSDKNFTTTTSSTFAYNSVSSNPFIPTVCNLTRNVVISALTVNNSSLYSSGNSKCNISNCEINNIINSLNGSSTDVVNISGAVFNNTINMHRDPNCSMFFDGTGQITTSFDSSIGTGQFTMEMWVYPILGGSGYNIVSDFYHQGSADAGWTISWNNTNYRIIWSIASATSFSFSTTLSSVMPNRWSHIAYVRDASNNLRCYINGVLNVLSACTTNIQGATDRLRFGNFRLDAINYYWTGYLSNFRLTKNQALYLNNFIPSNKRLTTTSQGASSRNVTFLLNDFSTTKDKSLYENPITLTTGVTFTPYENPFNYNNNTINKLNLINNVYSNYSAISSYGLNLTNSIINNSNIINNILLHSNRYGIYFDTLTSNNTTIKNNFVTTSSGVFISNCLSSAIGILSFKSNSYGVILSGINTGTFSLTSVYAKRDGIFVDASTNNLSGSTFNDAVARYNNSYGFKISGNNLNYLTPIILNINNLNVSNNLSGGLEAYNITGNLSSIVAIENNCDSIRTSIGNGPTIFDNLSAYASTLSNLMSVIPYTTTGTVVVTTFSPFTTENNKGSVYFDGTANKFLSITPSQQIFLNAGQDFTLESWIYPNTNTGNGIILGNYETWPTSNTFTWRLNNALKAMLLWNGGTNILTSPISCNANSWNHIAITRRSSVMYMFINGIMALSSSLAAYNTAARNTTFAYTIGASKEGDDPFKGYIAGLKYVIGTAIYTTNFTPNTSSKLQAHSNTRILLNFPNNGTYNTLLSTTNVFAAGLRILSAYNYSQTVIKNSFISASSEYIPLASTSVALSLDSSRFGEFSLDNSVLCAFTPLELNTSRNILEGSYLFNNTILGSTPLGTGITTKYQLDVFRNSGFAFTNLNRIPAYNVTYLVGGSRMLDYVTPSVQTSDVPSERLTPNSQFIKLRSGSKYVAVNAGDSTNISVYVRTSIQEDGTAYNGKPPRLILKSNAAVGATETVLAELNATNNVLGSYVMLTGSTQSAIDDGVFEFYIDCDGTSGWINIDNWNAV